eukprot:3766062-Rhodomonas_salina.1
MPRVKLMLFSLSLSMSLSLSLSTSLTLSRSLSRSRSRSLSRSLSLCGAGGVSADQPPEGPGLLPGGIAAGYY